jgi:hypothetical protein
MPTVNDVTFEPKSQWQKGRVHVLRRAGEDRGRDAADVADPMLREGRLQEVCGPAGADAFRRGLMVTEEDA